MHTHTTHTHLGRQFPPAYHRPFLRYFDGENGGAGGGNSDPNPAPPADPTPPPAPTPTPPTPQPAPPAPQPTPPVNYHGNPDDYVRELRGEAKQHREAYEAEQTAHKTTQAERDAAVARADSLAREKELILAAPKLGANVELLLDSSTFMKTFADVDLTKQDDVNKAITDALERNSAYKAGPQLPGASGGGHQGGQPPTTTPTLQGAVAARLGG